MEYRRGASVRSAADQVGRAPGRRQVLEQVSHLPGLRDFGPAGLGGAGRGARAMRVDEWSRQARQLALGAEPSTQGQFASVHTHRRIAIQGGELQYAIHNLGRIFVQDSERVTRMIVEAACG